MFNEDRSEYFLKQTKYSKKNCQIATKECNFDLFRANRHLLSCITQRRPEILAGVNVLSQVKKDTFQESDIKVINGLIKHVRQNIKSGLRYVSLGENTVQLVVYSKNKGWIVRK